MIKNIKIISFSISECFDKDCNKRYTCVYTDNGIRYKDDRLTTEVYNEEQYKKLLEDED